MSMALVEFERQPSLNWLPPELISEILVKLPLKSLLQFKCISKYYLGLISSSQFVKLHLNYNEQRRLILGFTGSASKKIEIHCVRSDSQPNPCVPFRLKFSIVGSVNGLICIATFRSEQFYLWNPSIRKCKKLTTLIPAPSNSSHYNFGFGYDEIHDDYKIVFIFASVKVDIFSVKNNSWRRIDDLQGHVTRLGAGKLVNRKLHWITTCNIIISIDLANEKWGNKMEYPCCVEGDEFPMRLGVLGSDLCMVRNYDKSFMDMWVMKDYGVKESWTKIYTIKFPPYISNNIFFNSIRTCFYCKLNGGEVLFLVGIRFVIYNPKDGSIRCSKVYKCREFFAGSSYIESLVCPFQN